VAGGKVEELSGSLVVFKGRFTIFRGRFLGRVNAIVQSNTKRTAETPRTMLRNSIIVWPPFDFVAIF
jgi:hypothetical protein